MPERVGNRRWKPDAERLLMAVAGIAAADAHTAFPAASVAGAVVAVSRVEQVDDWRRRLVGEIARWTKAIRNGR
jgi:hypothetical protein